MILKNFRINFIIRIILLSMNIYGFFLILFETNLYYIAITAGILSAVQTIFLIMYFEKNLKFLSLFCEYLKNNDLFQMKDQHPGEMKRYFNETMKVFRRNNIEKETRLQYLQAIIQNIGIGIIVIKENDEIVLLNRVSQLLLHDRNVSKVDELKKISIDLYNLLKNKLCEKKSLVKMSFENETLQLLLNVTDFTLLEENYRLVTIQNIYRELDENEVDSWQKLAKVLTHEIMNSIAPISSLASTSSSLLEKYFNNAEKETKCHADIILDVQNAARVIERRSKGLISFVEDYRQILRIPEPNFEVILAKELIDDITVLMNPQLKDKGIKLKTFLYPRTLEIVTDKDLIEQAIINLMKNSIEAMENTKDPFIDLSISNDMYDKPVIEVSDNGSGISKENAEKIFIPFFTTKPNGSGIGLSLCRQIMRFLNGSMSFKSVPDEKTSFFLRF